jgi:hypothetical protein
MQEWDMMNEDIQDKAECIEVQHQADWPHHGWPASPSPPPSHRHQPMHDHLQAYA